MMTSNNEDLEKSLLNQKKSIIINLNKKLDDVIDFVKKLKHDISQKNEVLQDTAIQFTFVFIECHNDAMGKMIKHVENYRDAIK
jgi:hypothetical protein